MKSTLQFNIVSVLFLIFVTSSGSVAWYTFENNARTVLELSDKIIRQVTESTIEKTLNYLAPLASAAEMTATVARSSTFTREEGKLTDYLTNFLAVHPRFFSLYAGYADSSYHQVINLPDGIKRFGSFGKKPPREARRVARLLDRSGAEPTESWTYLDAEGRILATEHSATITYDPLRRPWCGGARDGRGVYWTDLYAFFTSGEPGITASYPVRGPGGRILGVVGADVSLSVLSEFLVGQTIGETGVANSVSSRPVWNILVPLPPITQINPIFHAATI